MQFLVQMKIFAQGRATSPEARITLVENYIFPSLEVCRKLQEKAGMDVHEPDGYAMDDGRHARKAKADEFSARNDLHALRRHTEEQHRSFG